MSTPTVHQLVSMKRAGEKIAMITAYDSLFASLVDEAGVDVILVGDSLATVIGGEATTLPATLAQMIYHGRMVRRGASRALVVVDLPFLSYQVSIEEGVRNAGRVLKHTGAHAVKLEGGGEMAPTIRAIVRAGIPVMGHLGYTPQSGHALADPGGAWGADQAGPGEGDPAWSDRLVEDAREVEAAGAFSIVLSLVPPRTAERVTNEVSVPTIGIGSGTGCDGQVLVLHYMLGLCRDFGPEWGRRYQELGDAGRSAVERYVTDVKEGVSTE